MLKSAASDSSEVNDSAGRLVTDPETTARQSPSPSPRRSRWRRLLVILTLGQLISVCVTITAIAAEMSARMEPPYRAQLPSLCTFSNYALIFVVYGGSWLIRKFGCIISEANYAQLNDSALVDLDRDVAASSTPWWYFLALALCDVEANFLLTLAYRYTSMLSVLLLDAWTIPCVLLLTRLLFRQWPHRFQYFGTPLRWMHYVGVFVCLLGLGGLVYADSVRDDNKLSESGGQPILGDFLVLVGATLYAVSNVMQEHAVKSMPYTGVLIRLSFFAVVISGVQMWILEGHAIVNEIVWTAPAVLYIVLFVMALFAVYSLAPMMLRKSTASVFNLSLLTADFYGAVASLLIFQASFSAIYAVAFFLIICGLLLYNLPHK